MPSFTKEEEGEEEEGAADLDQTRTYLKELQPVIELLDEGKFFGAESICDIIDARYPKSEKKSLAGQCRGLLDEIRSYISSQGQGDTSLSDVQTHYRELRGQYL